MYFFCRRLSYFLEIHVTKEKLLDLSCIIWKKLGQRSKKCMAQFRFLNCAMHILKFLCTNRLIIHVNYLTFIS